MQTRSSGVPVLEWNGVKMSKEGFEVQVQMKEVC